jgi:hypothetical protein
MDTQTESGKSPAALAAAKVASMVRQLPKSVTLEQLQAIVREAADEFDVDVDEIDESVRENADEVASAVQDRDDRGFCRCVSDVPSCQLVFSFTFFCAPFRPPCGRAHAADLAA